MFKDIIDEEWVNTYNETERLWKEFNNDERKSVMIIKSSRFLAERVEFEPTDGCLSTDFELLDSVFR